MTSLHYLQKLHRHIMQTSTSCQQTILRNYAVMIGNLPYWPALFFLIKLHRFVYNVPFYPALHSTHKLCSYVQEPHFLSRTISQNCTMFINSSCSPILSTSRKWHIFFFKYLLLPGLSSPEKMSRTHLDDFPSAHLENCAD